MAHIVRRSHRAFTLVELMLVVTIIGVLASVAIPNFARLQLRSKAAERTMTMLTIKKAFDDRFLQVGQITPPGAAADAGGFQPPLPPTPAARMGDWKAAGWKGLDLVIEGATYYSYAYAVSGATAPQQLVIYAYGDLDGDGNISRKAMMFVTSNAGLQWVGEAPASGEEDEAGPDKTF
jgi:prepilin-type N-terminal cleavage/methylation domain-containing protein